MLLEFLLSTAEAVLRQEAIATEETKNAISIAYRLGGIETVTNVTITDTTA